MLRKKTLGILFLAIIFLITGGASCQLNLVGGKKEIKPDAGVWKSTNGGKDWKQMVLVPTITGQPQKIDRVHVVTMVMDPQDNKTLYLGTAKNGIYYTYDGGGKWMKMESFPNGQVLSIAVDPLSKCILFASFRNSIQRSTDCGRTWQEVFVTDNPKETITSLVVDFYNDNIVYAGTSSGVVHKSFDRGVSWSTPLNTIKAYIIKLYMDPHDSRIIYAATKKGLYKTADGGMNWDSLAESLKDFKGGNNYKYLAFIPYKNDAFLLASQYGILKTEDGGKTWQAIHLLTFPGKADIRVVGVDPQDDRIIYYATRTTFYKTTNNGSDWVDKKLFSTKAPTNLIVDPENPQILYMGFDYPHK